MKNSLLVLLAFFMLTGFTACERKPELDPIVVMEDKTTVNIPESLLADCDPLALVVIPAGSTFIQRGQTLPIISDWQQTHDACAANHKALADKVRKAFNRPAPVVDTKELSSTPKEQSSK